MSPAKSRHADSPSTPSRIQASLPRGGWLLCLGLILLATTLPACSKPSSESTPAAKPAAQAAAETPATTPAASAASAKADTAGKEAPTAAPATPAAITPQEEVRAAIESWRQDWQSKDLAKYISHYDQSFKTPGMNLPQWREYKKTLNKKYKEIEVKITDLEIRMTEKGALAIFKQDYRSDKFHGLSRKQLALKKTGDQWKIYRESNM